MKRAEIGFVIFTSLVAISCMLNHQPIVFAICAGSIWLKLSLPQK
jgi:hypothetical protein